MKPSECKREMDVCRLKESIKQCGDLAMMIQDDGAVILTHQRAGERADSTVTIPRAQFQVMIEWYQAEQ